MEYFAGNHMEDPQSELQPRSSGALAGVIAWAIIVTAIAVHAILPMLAEDEMDEVATEVVDSTLELQAKWILGFSEFLPETTPEAKKPILNSVEAMGGGPIVHRLKVATVLGEVGGPEAALGAIEKVDDAVDLYGVSYSESEEQIRDALEAIYLARANGDEPAADDAHLAEDRLGWFGKLAVATPGSEIREETLGAAVRLAVAIVSIGVAYFVLVVGGVVAIVVVGILALTNTWWRRWGITPSDAPSSIYAEIFAAWFVLFLGGQICAGLIGEHFPPEASMVPTIVAFLASLLAVAWGPIRGVPFSKVRADIGWVGGRWGVLEPAAGVLGYAMSMPLLIAGLVFMLALMYVLGLGDMLQGVQPEGFEPDPGPAHPIVAMAGGSGWMVLQIFVLASICAPVVEETMFRGVLYRHLRGLSWKLGALASIAVSAAINSLIFAAIHPQGLVAIPVLGSLAVGFTLIRECRNSLIPSMVAHGLSNALVMTILVFAIS